MTEIFQALSFSLISTTDVKHSVLITQDREIGLTRDFAKCLQHEMVLVEINVLTVFTFNQELASRNVVSLLR